MNETGRIYSWIWKMLIKKNIYPEKVRWNRLMKMKNNYEVPRNAGNLEQIISKEQTKFIYPLNNGGFCQYDVKKAKIRF